MGMAARPDPIAPDTHQLIASDRVEGTPVRRPDGKKLGEIKRLMIDKTTGKVAYAVMSFGGFLHIGEKYHAVPWDALKYDGKLGAYEFDISDDDLQWAAARENLDWGERLPPLPTDYSARYWGV